VILVNLVYFGPQDEFQPYVNQFVDLDPTQWRNITAPWNNLIPQANFGSPSNGCDTNEHINMFSIALNKTDPLTFQGFFDDMILFSQMNPTYSGAWVIERYGSQGPLAVPEESRGVYPWRDAKMQL
jgi:fumiquinazoline A oxidase